MAELNKTENEAVKSPEYYAALANQLPTNNNSLNKEAPVEFYEIKLKPPLSEDNNLCNYIKIKNEIENYNDGKISKADNILDIFPSPSPLLHEIRSFNDASALKHSVSPSILDLRTFHDVNKDKYSEDCDSSQKSVNCVIDEFHLPVRLTELPLSLNESIAEVDELDLSDCFLNLSVSNNENSSPSKNLPFLKHDSEKVEQSKKENLPAVFPDENANSHADINYNTLIDKNTIPVSGRVDFTFQSNNFTSNENSSAINDDSNIQKSFEKVDLLKNIDCHENHTNVTNPLNVFDTEPTLLKNENIKEKSNECPLTNNGVLDNRHLNNKSPIVDCDALSGQNSISLPNPTKKTEKKVVLPVTEEDKKGELKSYQKPFISSNEKENEDIISAYGFVCDALSGQNSISLPNPTKKTEKKVVLPVIEEDKKGELKSYQKPFISSNEKENEDINDPEWDKLRKLKTDKERYVAIRNSWKNLTTPDPNENLTYHAYRRRQMPLNSMHFSQPVPNISSKKRKGDHNEPNQCPSKKRRIFRDLSFNNRAINLTISSLKQDYNEEIASNCYTDKRYNELENRYREYLKQLENAREEAQAIFKFYSGLSDQKYLTQSELEEEQWDIEQLYKMFKTYYGWTGKVFNHTVPKSY